MGIIYGKPLMSGGQKPSQLNVTTNGTWSKTGGYSPVNVNVPASAVTSGTKIITANGDYDVTEFKIVRVKVGPLATTSPVSGVSYVDGLPSDWNRIKEIGMAISEASGSINANTTGSVYVNNGNTWAYKITPGNTINITSQMGTHAYAVVGFNNFALSNQANYGGTHSTAGLTFGAVDCVSKDKMNETDSNAGGWGDCKMNTITMDALEKLTQLALPQILAEVKVPYVDYANQSILLYSDNYMFLPAEKEVFGTSTWSLTTEANALTQFAYYKNGGSRIKNLSGSSITWWLRSSGNDSSLTFCYVNGAGYTGYMLATGAYGTVPCFCV